ncbi:MAG: SPOR domain-containing protein [Xylophilus ampelinus]
MGFFKFRWPRRRSRDDDRDAPRPSPAENVDSLRRRARHRLIGATVLVALGVVGFPMLFDTQPRPVKGDIPITMADRPRDAAAPAPAAPAAPAASAEPAAPRPAATAEGGNPPPPATAALPPAARPQNPPSAALRSADGLSEGEEIVPGRPTATAVAEAARKEEAARKAEVARREKEREETARKEAAARREKEAEARKEAQAQKERDGAGPRDDAARARALLEGKAPAAASGAPASAASDGGSTRFVIQVGAFAEASKALEARDKLSSNGVKAFTQAVDTDAGKRTRVRAGPFASRAEADQAAARIKGLGLPASVIPQ